MSVVRGSLGRFVLVQDASADTVRGSLGQFVLVQSDVAATTITPDAAVMTLTVPTPAVVTASGEGPPPMRILRTSGYMLSDATLVMR